LKTIVLFNLLVETKILKDHFNVSKNVADTENANVFRVVE